MGIKITFLGTGTSSGVPLLGCSCPVCNSKDPKDQRMRSSILIESPNGHRLLMDCGPDFRWQMLAMLQQHEELANIYQQSNTNNQPFFDAVLITHAHNDHIAGLDDLRPFSVKQELTLYGEKSTLEYIVNKYSYCFKDAPKNLFIPRFKTKIIVENQTFQLYDLTITPIRLNHGNVPTIGYRINNIAYLTDLKTIPEDQYRFLEHIDLLIIDAIHWQKEHPTHQNFEQAFEVVKHIAPKTTYFIHMSHHAGLHAITEQQLPKDIHLSYDGLQLEY